MKKEIEKIEIECERCGAWTENREGICDDCIEKEGEIEEFEIRVECNGGGRKFFSSYKDADSYIKRNGGWISGSKNTDGQWY